VPTKRQRMGKASRSCPQEPSALMSEETHEDSGDKPYRPQEGPVGGERFSHRAVRPLQHRSARFDRGLLTAREGRLEEAPRLRSLQGQAAAVCSQILSSLLARTHALTTDSGSWTVRVHFVGRMVWWLRLGGGWGSNCGLKAWIVMSAVAPATSSSAISKASAP
jgi:hypothetical protein